MNAASCTFGSLALLATIGLLVPEQPPAALDFSHDVLPVLQRYGCSSAYCHGSATGRAGFRLSLFGSDAQADFAAITRQFGGRRIDLREPDRSLILQKAQGRLDHGGGRRIAPGGAAYAGLREWIAAGAPWREGDALELAALEIRRNEDRVLVEATLKSTGGVEIVRDVSDLALFSSGDPTVVEVDASGRLQPRGRGQAHVIARYGNRTATLRIVRPFGNGEAVATAPAHGAHALDRAWSAHLAELGLQPLGAARPQVLARRLHLDLVGRPPTPAELDQFVQEPDVAATVRRLTERREFAEVWGGHLAMWFELSIEGLNAPAAAAARRGHAALVAAVAAGESLPAMARRIVLGARDDGDADGGAGLVDRFADARDRAEYAGRTLLGMRVGCARCHDHPADRWRRSQHLAFSACFAAPRPDGSGGTMAGAMFDIDSGERIEPSFLPLPAAARVAAARARDPGDTGRRDQLADFLLATDHDAFARNACNRIFAILLGSGLVEPLDDHRDGNPPLDAGMLAALRARFHDCHGQLPQLLAFVCTSMAYRVTGADEEGPPTAHFAARASRPLSPETFRRALAAVTGGAPADVLPRGPLARELALRNGRDVRALLAAGGGTTIDATYDLCGTPRERLRELWRTLLSRAPRPDEVRRMLPFADDPAAFRDLAYGILTGREFGHLR